MVLTPKQRRFVDEYLINQKATQAAIRAGYSAKTANEQGARLLVNVGVQREIQARMKARERRTTITEDRVLQEYARIPQAFIQPTDNHRLAKLPHCPLQRSVDPGLPRWLIASSGKPPPI